MGNAAKSVKNAGRRFASGALGSLSDIESFTDPLTIFHTGIGGGDVADAIRRHIDPSPTVQPDTPATPPPERMPVPGPDTIEAISARRRSIQAQLARRGRLSTILTGQDEPLGG